MPPGSVMRHSVHRQTNLRPLPPPPPPELWDPAVSILTEPETWKWSVIAAQHIPCEGTVDLFALFENLHDEPPPVTADDQARTKAIANLASAADGVARSS